MNEAGRAVGYFTKPPQSGKAFLDRCGRQCVYDLLNSIDLVVFASDQSRCVMPKLSQYMSYAALAAALFLGFAVTVLVGLHF